MCRRLAGAVGTRRVNFDGLLFSTPMRAGGADLAYVQLFRNGVIEAVDCERSDPVATPQRQRPDKYHTQHAHMRGTLFSAVDGYAEFYNEVRRCQRLLLVGLSILNVKGFYVWVTR